MGIFLPIISFIAFGLFFKIKYASLGWRAGYLLSASLLFSLSVLFLEGMSLFSGVTAVTVRLFWVVVAGLSVAILARTSISVISGTCTKLKDNLVRVPEILRSLKVFEWACLFSIVLILLVNAFVAFIAPPNNWDSMTYHLPRVMHWAANASVYFYPTDIERQLFISPGAEYALLHILFLTGDDRWFNFLQWVSLAGCVVSVSLIARYLGASLSAQFLAGLFVVTLPMAVLQSTSTQNDLVASFCVCACMALGLLLYKRFSRTAFFAAAALLGLSILTKGAFLFLLPFLGVFIVLSWVKVSRYVVLALCIVLVLAGGHYFRCAEAQKGRGVINQEQASVLMSRHDPAAVMVNGVCQLASELIIPFYPVARFLKEAPGQAAAWVGVDLKKGLFFYTFSGLPGPSFVFDEDYAPNPWHVMIILLLPVFLLCMKAERKIWLYYLYLLIAGVLFLFMIRWQPWIVRLHLPLLILFAPLAGLALARWRWLSVLSVVGLLLVAGTAIVFHQTRPLTGQNSILKVDRKLYYFAKKPGDARAYFQAASGIMSSDCRQVGLIQGVDSWEYPLWALTGYGKVNFRKVETDAQTPWACLVVTINSPRERVVTANGTFVKVWEEAPLQILMRQR
jgi:hypothetical protein